MKIVLISIILIFAFLGFVSAETIITGKIYNSTMLIDENSVSNALVAVRCYHENLTYTKETTSVSDGTYGVYFNDSECNVGDNVNVTATKDNLKGSNIGIVHYEAGMNISVVNVVIEPFEIKIKEKGYHRKREFCGDLICGNSFWEDETTCPEDCFGGIIKKVKHVPTEEALYIGEGVTEKEENKLNILAVILIEAIFIILLLILILIAKGGQVAPTVQHKT